MKNLKTIALALFVAVSTIATAQTKKVDASKSTINWVGKKVTGSHSGTVGIKEGSLIFKGKKLAGGNFTVNTASIEVTDLKAGQGKENLEGHLKADDFFGTDKYPTSKLVFKTIGDKGNGVYSVTADLTIKDITSPVKFDLTVKGNTATTAFNVDRTKYGIKFKSKNFFENLGDNVINDDFELTVSLQF